MVNVVDRIRVSFLRRELSQLQGIDREDRNATETMADMMQRVADRAERIVYLMNRIRELEGEPEEAQDTDFDPRTPSSLFIPTRGEP